MYEISADGTRRLVLPPEYAAWCRTPFNYLDAVPANDTPLQIVNPRTNGRFLRSRYLPDAQQMLVLRAVGDLEQNKRWFVDGHEIESYKGYFLWPLRAGEHEVELRCAGQRLTVHFRVEE